MGITPADVAAPDASAPLTGDDDEDEDDEQDQTKEGGKQESKLLAGLPIKKKIKLASKGTREQRAQLIRDPNKLVAAAVLSSPKLTDAEVANCVSAVMEDAGPLDLAELFGTGGGRKNPAFERSD